MRYRICPFCEATCGLALEVEGETVKSIRGDEEDVLSRGFICPKGVALAQLDQDPDRLRQPMIRRGGKLEAASWDDAFAEVERHLLPIIAESGNDAVAAYLGNPSVHSLSLGIYGQVMLRALRTRNIFSASTVDQMPKQLSVGLMFGNFLSIPVPDIDRCDLLVILGANPLDSNGSLWTVPDFPARLRELRQRGGRCITIDPRRTRTAHASDEHFFIHPGTDAHLLAGIVHTLFAENLVNLGALEAHMQGVDEMRAAAEPFAPEVVAPVCGIAAADIRRIARDLARSPRAAVYGRIGTCTQAFGTAASWLVDVCNVLTGNLDRPGGAMFPLAAAFAGNSHGRPGIGRGVVTGRRRSRVRGAPEVFGEFPAACLAEEIETPGDGRIRALITVAGNPVLSTPNGARLARALDSLDFMLSLDIYINETTRHADVILPGPSPLRESHYDIAFNQFSCRNTVRYSPPVFEAAAGAATEWQTMLRLAAILSGQRASADVEVLDTMLVLNQVQRAVADEHSPIRGRDAEEILQALETRRGPERLLDLRLRIGPYGDGFGSKPDGITLTKLIENPHGIDLGPLQPRIPEILRTRSGKIELSPPALLADLERVRASISAAPANGGFVLIGRRHLRSNNSWMHNLPSLAGGRSRCTLLINPADASRLGLDDGSSARVTSRAGCVVATIEATADIMPGVVSLPHGWGHDHDGARLNVARRNPGVNSNLVSDEYALDPLSGNAVLNGIPVKVEAVA